MGPLAKVYSAADSLKRHLFAPSGGVLSDPVGNAQITAGRIQDDLREYDASSDEEKQAAILRKITDLAPLGMFIGKGAKLWDPQKAEDFLNMVKNGMPAATRWKKTGTMQFPDGKLRQEIPDNEAFLDWNPARDGPEQLSGVLSHTPLMRAYGDNVDKIWVAPEAGVGGSWSDPVMKIGVGSDKYPGGPKAVALHEVQHAIQNWEGFAKGGSPKEFLDVAREDIRKQFQGRKLRPSEWEYLNEIAKNEATQDYMKLAGEAEARLTERRMNLDKTARLHIPPWKMWDVPATDQTVRGVKTDIQLENQRRLAEILRKRGQQP